MNTTRIWESIKRHKPVRPWYESPFTWVSYAIMTINLMTGIVGLAIGLVVLEVI